jgi:hypothetical protein
MPILRTFHMDLHLPTQCSTKNSNNKCLENVAFERLACFQIIGNHLHIGINKKKHLQDMMPLNRGGDKYQVLVHGPVSL